MKRGRKRITTEKRVENFKAWVMNEGPTYRAIVRRFKIELTKHAAGLSRRERKIETEA